MLAASAPGRGGEPAPHHPQTREGSRPAPARPRPASSSARSSSPSLLQILLQTASLWGASTLSSTTKRCSGVKRLSCFREDVADYLSGTWSYVDSACDSAHAAVDTAYDLVLSSGFLSFASHSGFLKAVDDYGVRVAGVMGTSAGALSGSLYCAGYTPLQVAQELSRVAPINLLRPECRVWRGAISLDAVVERLRDLLPPTFEDLQTELAVGVVNRHGELQLVKSGPLPEAVAASAAIPYLFSPVTIPGREEEGPFRDGGVVDRTGLVAWRKYRAEGLAAGEGREAGAERGEAVPPAIVHLISRSSAFSGNDDVAASGERRVTVVRSPKSGVNFFSLGAFEEQLEAAYRRAEPAVQEAIKRHRSRSPIRQVRARA